MKISVITPCFNEKDNIEECVNSVKNFFEKKKIIYEHIISDNKSNDGTIQILRKIAEYDNNIKVILNTRNFDPFKSTFNALKYATGDAVVVSLAADLQDPVEVIEEFIKKWEEGYKVVYGQRKNRKDDLLKSILRKCYYTLYSSLDKQHYGNDIGEFMLIDKKVHKILISIDDHYPYIRGIISYLNFPSFKVIYDQKIRQKGKSKYTVLSHFPQAINAFISFSNKPIRFILYFGFIASILSFIYAIYLLIRSLLVTEVIEPGIKTLLISTFIFFSIIIFFLGILGEYIVSIHSSVRKKPMVVEEEKINLD